METEDRTVPAGIHHLAVATADIRSTLHFYCEKLGLPLAGLFWMHGVEGAVHAFVPFPDGRMLSFIQFAEDRPQEKGITFPGWAGGVMPAGTMQHLAFGVRDAQELQQLRDRLEASEVAVAGPIDHGFCTSIYFAGPENVQLEATYQSRSLDDREFEATAVALVGMDEAEVAALRRGGGR
jgi:catechol 2,3-dioxygenase-like lactoylglutathione lyase family enzyme